MNNIPADALGNYGGTINAPTVPDLNFDSAATVEGPKKTMSFNDMYKQSLDRSKSAQIPSVPLTSIPLNSRYKSAVPFENTEEMYAQQQGIGSKWLNAGLKTAGTFTSSFIGGTAGLVWGVGEAIATKRLAAISDNVMNRKVDELNESMEKALPNYETLKESTADAISTDNLLSANFWSNKALKNLGFAAGALAGGGVWAKLFKSVNALNNLVLAGRGMETATAIEESMAAVPNASKYTAFNNALTSTIQKYGVNPIAQGLKQSERVTISTLGAFGEGSIESMQKMKQFKEQLTNDFVLKYGRQPKGEELQQINDYTDKVGKYVLAGNLLLLSATNYLQLPKILGSSRRFDKALINEVEQKELGGAWSAVVHSGLNKLGRRAYNAAGLVFSPSEAFEEGGQYAISEGVASYFNKAYKNQKDTGTMLSNIYGSMNSVLGEGWDKVFTDKEGIESLILGGVTGGIQQSGIVGTYKDENGKTKIGIGKSGEIAERGLFGEGGERATNTEIAIDALNKANVKKQLQTQTKYMSIALGSQQERQEAIVNNDKLKEKDAEHDYVMSYVMPRVLYGKEESVHQELEWYASQATTQEGFNELKSEGIVSPNEEQVDFLERINNLKSLTKSVTSIYDNIKDRYEDVIKKDGSRMYKDETIEKMVYATAKINNYDQRIPQVNNKLVSAGINTSEILNSIFEKGKPNKELFNKELENIDKIGGIDTDVLKEDLIDLVRMSRLRNTFIKEYNDIKKNPSKYEDSQTLDTTVTTPDKKVDKKPSPPAAATQNQPSATDKDVAAPIVSTPPVVKPIVNIVNSKGNTEELEIDRDYINNDLYPTDPLHKFKVTDINPDGTVNVTLNDGSTQTIAPEALKGSDKIRTGKDNIIDNAQEIKEIQDELEDKTDFSTGFERDEYIDNKEGAIPSADRLFFRTTTASRRQYGNNLPVNVTRFNEFTNNLDNFPNRKNIRFIYVTQKQQESLGLNKLAELSYMKGPEFESSSEWVDSITGVKDGLVAAVFVEQDNGTLYLIDKDGKRIKNQEGSFATIGNPNNNFDISQVIFSATPKTEGVGRSSDDPAVVDHYRKLWEDKRKDLFTWEYKQGDPIDSYEFELSKGFGVREEGVVQKNPISKVFNNIKQSIISNTKGLIKVSTLGYITHKDGTNYKFAVGRPVLAYGDKLEFLQNSKFDDAQVATIVEVLKKLHEVLVDPSLSKSDKLKKSNTLTSYLKGVLYWTSKKITHNSFFINYSTGNINIAGKEYDFSNIEGNRAAITDALKNVYFNTSNQLLTKEFDEPFYEQYWTGNELKERKWKNYQTYLLSDKLPDGKTARKAPLTVNISEPTDAVPYVYEQKYAFPTNMKLAVPAAPKVTSEPADIDVKQIVLSGVVFNFTVDEAGPNIVNDDAFDKSLNTFIDSIPALSALNKQDSQKASDTAKVVIMEKIKQALAKPAEPVGYAIDGITQNTIEIQGIKFLFTHDGVEATIDTSDEFLEGPLTDGIDALIASDSKYKDLDPIQLAKALIEVAKTKANAAVTEQLAKEASKAPVSTKQQPSSDIEAKKADIKKRRQEELNNNLTLEQLDFFVRDTKKTAGSAVGGRQPYFSFSKKVYKEKEELFDSINAKYDTELAKELYKEMKAGKNSTEFTLDEQRLLYDYTIFTPALRDSVDAELAALENQAPTSEVNELFDLEETLGNYELSKDFGFVTPLLKANNIRVSFDRLDADGNLPKIAAIDTTVVDGKYEIVLTINRSTFDKLSKTQQKYVIAHEFVHGLIKVRLNEKGDIKGTELYKGLQSIFNDVNDYFILNKNTTLKKNFSDRQIREIGEKLKYASGSIEEMAAIGLTDPDMIKLLTLMPGTEGIYTKKNLFTQLVELVSKLVGIPTSKFNDLLTFISKQLEETEASTNINLGNASRKYTQGSAMPKKKKGPRNEFPVFSQFTAEQKYYLVQDMTAKFYITLFNDNRSLFNIDTTSADQIFKEIITNDRNEGVNFTDDQYKELVEATKRQLKSLYIDFNEDEVRSINDENATNRLYAPEAFSVDLKKSTPYAVKILLSSLVRTDGKFSEDLTLLPEPKLNREHYDAIELIPENEAYSVLVNKLVNVKNVNDFIKKLHEIATSNPDYVQLFARLGGNYITGEVDFDAMDDSDFRLFIGAMQTFTKSKPEMFIQYLKEGSTFRGSADLTTGARQVERRWINNIILNSKKKDSVITYDRAKKQYVVTGGEFNISNPEEMINFLSALGINFPMSTYDKLNKRDIAKFSRAVTKIYTDITSANKKGIVTLKKGRFKTLGNGISRLADLYTAVEMPNQNNSIYNAEGKRINTLTESNYPSVFEYQFNSLKNLSEIEEKMPYLSDVFSSSSEILKPGGLFFDEDGERITDEEGKPRELKVQVISGQIDSDDNTGENITSLTRADRYITEINQNLNGSYYILVPADSSTEWMINLGNRVSLRQFSEGRGIQDVVDIMKNHLDADVRLAVSYMTDRVKLANVGSKGKDLRFFKDILSESTLDKIEKLIDKRINEEIDQEDFDAELNEIKNTSKVQSDIESYISSSGKSTIDKLRNLKLLSITDTTKDNEELYGLSKIDSAFAEEIKSSNGIDINRMTNEQVTILGEYLASNFILNNIELHKLIFGDPYQFAIKKKNGKSVLEQTKRVKLFLSPRKYSIDFDELNNWLNESYNTIFTDTTDIELTSEDFGYHENKSYINTSVVTDVNIIGSLYANVETNEADGFSVTSPGFYREVNVKNSQWSDEAQAFHNWQMAYARKQLAAKNIYKGYDNHPGLKKYDEELTSKDCPKFVINVIKPVVSGSKYGKSTIDLVGHKMSQMPLYYQAVENTALEDLFVKMFNEQIDYVVMESGSKVGTETAYDLYTDGKINQEKFNNIVRVPFSAYGIQVETGYVDKKGQTLGSQPTKIVTMDLYAGGNPIGKTPEEQEEIKKLVERHDNALRRMYEESSATLLDDLGITFNEEGKAEITDYSKVSELLKENLINNDSSDNTIESLALNFNNTGFESPLEASTSYMKISRLLYSLVTKRIISPKVNGMSAVQVPVTGWENLSKGRKLAIKKGDKYEQISTVDYEALSDEDKKKVRLTDDTLKFYEDVDGKRYCEVMVTLPKQARALFSDKKKFPNDEAIINYLNEMAPDALMGIGFRIPTQALSSIERFKIKKLLPDFMGTTVVVPSEITTKAGSDFDIDKLNMYLKSLYKDVDGNIKVATLLETEEATKEHFGKVFDKLSDKEIKKLMESIDDEDYEGQERLILKQESLPERREKYIRKMYRAAVENEYFSAIDAILSLPQNFKRLTAPNTAADLEKIASELDELTGYDESTIKNRILNREYLTDTRFGFIASKSWVGIAATAITGHSNAQKAGLFVDHIFNRILKQNTTEDGKVDLSQLTEFSEEGKENVPYISDNLSQATNAIVDAGSNPFILKILYSEQIVPAFMYLIRSGSTLRQASLYLNQPIIKDFVLALDASNKYISSEIVKDDSSIIDDITSMYATTQAAAESAVVDVSKFADNIKNSKTLNYAEKAEQLALLKDFFNTVKAANGLYIVTDATNYDTIKISNADDWRRKQMKTISQYKFEEDSFRISSAKQLLDKTHLRTLVNVLTKVYRSFGTVLRFNTPEYRVILNNVIDAYATNKFISKDKFSRIANKLSASLLDYIIQTNKNFNIDELVYGENSVISAFNKAVIDHPEIKILQDLEVIPGKTIVAPSTIALKVAAESAVDINRYTEGFRELRDNPKTNDLYNKLVRLAIVQGTYKTAVSYREAIPHEDISTQIEQAINAPGVVSRLEDFVKNARFQRTNFNDPTIAPRVKPSLNEREEYSRPTPSGDIIDFYEIANAISFGKDVSKSNKQLIGLHPKSKGGSYDFVTIPRALPLDSGDMVDFETGYVIQGSDYFAQMQKDESEYNEVYGYQKVKYSNGTPVKIKLNEHSKEVYAYKLVNLYGDGRFLTEYTNTVAPSKLSNGTVKVNKEYSDQAIINWLGKQGKLVGYTEVTAPVQQTASLEKPIQTLIKSGILEFNTLPSKSATPTMTYAGIGSRETPQEILDKMTEVAKYLDEQGYTLNTGKTYPTSLNDYFVNTVHKGDKEAAKKAFATKQKETEKLSKLYGNKVGMDEEGADRAFSAGASKKNLFSPMDKIGDKEMKIAKEIHPNWSTLSSGAAKLMARNTNQIFGDNLDTPVDFVLFYAEEVPGSIRPKGGTGQAVEMARRKGIPTINMADANWRDQLKAVLNAKPIVSQPALNSKFEGNMTFSYRANKRSDVKADTTFDAILNGERTATTRYESDENLDYWRQAKVGDIITWRSADGRTVDVVVTKALHPLKGSGKTAEQWSKLEGWSTTYFSRKVKSRLDEAWQIEYKLLTPTSTTVTSESSMIKLKDGNRYEISKINATLLNSLGYSVKESGKILKSIC